MPRPNAKWQQKFGSNEPGRRTLLSPHDDILSAAKKLADGVNDAYGVVLQAIKGLPGYEPAIRLLDMDDMGLHGQKIVDAYLKWSGKDYSKLINAVRDRDESLVKFIRSI